MTIVSDFALNLANLFSIGGLATSHTYTQATTGDTATVNAIAQGIDAFSKQIDPLLADHQTYFVLASELSTITPEPYDTISNGVDTWRVESIKYNIGGVYALLCSRAQRVRP